MKYLRQRALQRINNEYLHPETAVFSSLKSQIEISISRFLMHALGFDIRRKCLRNVREIIFREAHGTDWRLEFMFLDFMQLFLLLFSDSDLDMIPAGK